MRRLWRSSSSSVTRASCEKSECLREGIRSTSRRSPAVTGQEHRPRIALVAHDIHNGGGMEQAFAELIRRAHTRFDFVVFAATLAPELRPLVTWQHVRIPARPMPLKMLAFFVRGSLPLARARVDLVHTLGALIPNRANLISVHYCHAGARAKTGRLAPKDATHIRRLNTTIAKGLAIVAERYCYRPARAQILAAVSPGVVSELKWHYPGVPVALTPNGVDNDRFRPDPAVRAQVRGAEGVRDEVICLFVGGDWDRKGLAVAIAALARADEETRLLLWVVGPGDRRRFEQLAVDLGVGERVRFLGPRPDTEIFYQAADTFVLPTEYETFSLVAYEAAASGLPVVATQVSGIEDVVVDGESGFLVERTPDAVADALVSLAMDSELRVRMGQEGRRSVSAYTWERSVESIVRVYEQLLDKREAVAG